MRNVTYPVFTAFFAILGVVSGIGVVQADLAMAQRAHYLASAVGCLTIAVLWEVARRLERRPSNLRSRIHLLIVFSAAGLCILGMALVFALVN